jgi:anhydro-N-acetylmuramic acid kinase
VPWTDAVLFAHRKLARCIQNIGGIANVTYLGTDGTVLAFDSGPGNMLLDATIALATNGRERFDRDARRAQLGRLHKGLFAALRRHPYFERRPPKSTGREDFGLPLAEAIYRRCVRTRRVPIEDVLYTLTNLTAWSIVDAYRQFLPQFPDEVILCGGGADNPLLLELLRQEFLSAGGAQTIDGPSELTVRRIDDLGIPNKAKEAVSFALLAAASLEGVPSNVPAVTGAQRPVVLGVCAPPSPPSNPI